MGEGRLVETGAFRVDSRRALEVLRKRQIADSFWRPALWVRCAAACGATRMSFVRKPGALSVVFDGRPLPEQALGAPFSRLLGAEGSAAERCFGWALLHSLRPGVAVRVASGPAARSYGDDGRPVRSYSHDRGTEVTARWSVWRRTDRAHPAEWPLLRSVGDHDYRLIDLAEAAPFPIRFKDGGAELTQRPWPRRELVEWDAQTPTLRLYLLGTLVHADALGGFPFPLRVSLADDALSVDASLESAVRDAAFRAAERRARDAAGRTALAEIARHTKAFRLAGPLLLSKTRLRLDWVRAMGLTRGDEPFIESLKMSFSDARRSGDRQRVLRAAESTRRLRSWAAAGLRSRLVDSRDPLRDALWKAPLFFTTWGRPLSLDKVDADSGRLPQVWRGLAPPKDRRGEALWSLSPMDTVFLRTRFPNRPKRA